MLWTMNFIMEVMFVYILKVFENGDLVSEKMRIKRVLRF